MKKSIIRLTPQDADQYISKTDDVLDYPAAYFTITPCTIPGMEDWEDVTYYTSRRKSYSNDLGSGRYWIYVLSNQSMPNLLKIGYTKQDPKDRAQQISSATGVATPFIVEYIFRCNEGEFLESEIHKYLDQYRVSNNREFFNIDLSTAIEAITSLGKKYTTT